MMYLTLYIEIPADSDGGHHEFKFNEAPSLAYLALASMSFCFSEQLLRLSE